MRSVLKRSTRKSIRGAHVPPARLTWADLGRLKFSATLVVSLIASISPALGQNTIEPEFRFLETKNQEMRSKVGSVTYDFVLISEYSFPKIGRLSAKWNSQVIESGEYQAATRHSIVRPLNANIQAQETTTSSVVGPTYFIERLNSAPQATQYLYASTATMSERAKSQARAWNGISIRLYGFGDGDVTLDAPYLNNPKITRWEIRDLDKDSGDPRYELTRYALTDGAPEKLESRWIIDSAHGYMVTKVTHFTDEGKPYQEVTTTPAEVSEGVFLPAHVENIQYNGRFSQDTVIKLGLKNEDQPSSSVSITFSSIKLANELPPEMFSVSYLGMRNGSIVDQVAPTGEHKTLLVVSNQIVDPTVARAMMSQIRMDDLGAQTDAGSNVNTAGGLSPNSEGSPEKQSISVAEQSLAQQPTIIDMHNWQSRWLIVVGSLLVTLCILFCACFRNRRRAS